jgi:hypothetical protein
MIWPQKGTKSTKKFSGLIISMGYNENKYE